MWRRSLTINFRSVIILLKIKAYNIRCNNKKEGERMIMTYIDEYIAAAAARMPIFTQDIFAYVATKDSGVDKQVLNEYIVRYAKRHPEFKRYKKGIYYKAVVTAFGEAGMDMQALAVRMYIGNERELIGYESGPSFMNKMGLTTQLPKYTYITTQRAKTSAPSEIGGVYLVRAVTKITPDNRRYLQFLDVLENQFDVQAEVSDERMLLRKHMQTHGLTFERLLYYARFYKNKAALYAKIAALAEGEAV